MTLRGRVGLRLGLHHRLADRLPIRLVDRLIELRTKYYRWRLEQAG